MEFEPLIMEPIKLPISFEQIRTIGWDGFGHIVGLMIGTVPGWMLFVIPIILVVHGKKLIPLFARWVFRYVTRSSFLG